MNTAEPLVAKTHLPQPDRPDTAALLGALDRATLAAMDEAGALAAECQRVLAKTGDNIVGELLRGSDTFYEWNHYPKGDVFDRETNAQYLYHAHPQELRSGEHGHFHTFMRPKGMPKGVKPARVPHFVAPKGDNDALSHLIAISMDKFGNPIRLFTTNRWVTGEVWYAADDVVQMLDAFEIDHAQPSWPANRWVGRDAAPVPAPDRAPAGPARRLRRGLARRAPGQQRRLRGPPAGDHQLRRHHHRRPARRDTAGLGGIERRPRKRNRFRPARARMRRSNTPTLTLPLKGGGKSLQKQPPPP